MFYRTARFLDYCPTCPTDSIMQTVPKTPSRKGMMWGIYPFAIDDHHARRSENHQGKDTKEWSHLRHASAQAEALCSRMLESILALRLDKSCLGLSIGDIMMSSMKGRKLPTTCLGDELIGTMTPCHVQVFGAYHLEVAGWSEFENHQKKQLKLTTLCMESSYWTICIFWSDITRPKHFRRSNLG
jgi:hypothetical protein